MTKKKDGILIDVEKVGNGWTGGVYYAANIYFLLSQNEYISQNYSTFLFCNKDQVKLLDELLPDAHLIVAISPNKYLKKIQKILFCITRRIRVLYWRNSQFPIFRIRTVSWIPDFQHKHFPEFFLENELKIRDDEFTKIARNKKTRLVISSKNALNDFEKYYAPLYSKCYLVPFVSYIENIISNLDEQKEKKILDNYGLKKAKYACVMNQFWQHKNHKVIFDAMEVLYAEHPDCEIKIVATGKMEDYRNPGYIDELIRMTQKDTVSNHLVNLGYIDRREQIAIMKNAMFVIQPSLFEGWGTVVEDAKVLDKTILLSDIPVHHEQMNEKCILFNPKDPISLAELIYKESQKEHRDDIETGIIDMYRRAQEYSKGFEKLIRDMETDS